MSNWWAFLGWYENVFVWPLAIAALVLLIRATNARRRALFAAALVVLFLPHTQKAIGNVYFDYLCRTQAGEFIYMSVKDVPGVVQLRNRDYSKDYFDEARNGRFPEDPVGHMALGWGGEAGGAFVLKTDGTYRGIYEYFEEVTQPATGTPEGKLMCTRHSSFDQITGRPETTEVAAECISRFGYTYKGFDSPLLTVLEIAGGQTEVIAVNQPEPLAVFRGFVRTGRRYEVCPKFGQEISDQPSLRKFVTRVLLPVPPSIAKGG